MKKLILILSILSFYASGQTQIDPGKTINVALTNEALSGSLLASGVNTYTDSLTLSGKTTYYQPLALSVTFRYANTSTSTFNFNNWGAKTIKKFSSGSLVDLSSGDISAGETKRLRYNGTYWIIEGGTGSGGGGSGVSSFNSRTGAVSPTSGDYTFAQIGSKPTTLSGYGITDPVVVTSGSYSNPSWLTALAWSKLTSTPTTLSGYGITDAVPSTRTINSQPLSADITLTKSNIGLSNADNTSDVNKPVSTAQQTAIDGKVADAINDGTTTIAPSQNATYDALALKANKALSPNTKTADYTLILTDADVKAVEMNSASTTNVTVPPNSSVAFPIGTIITVVQKNTGSVTIVQGAGVTVTPPAGGNLNSPGQGQPMQLWQRATDDWYLWNGGGPAFWNLTGTSITTTPTIQGKETWTQSSESSTNTFQTWTQAAHTGGSPTGWLYTAGAHTNLATGTEAIDWNLNLARTVQFATGAKTLQRAGYIQAPTWSAVGASTFTRAVTLAISGEPGVGTNSTFTNAYALDIESGRMKVGNFTPGTPAGGISASVQTTGEIRASGGFNLRSPVNNDNTKIGMFINGSSDVDLYSNGAIAVSAKNIGGGTSGGSMVSTPQTVNPSSGSGFTNCYTAGPTFAGSGGTISPRNFVASTSFNSSGSWTGHLYGFVYDPTYVSGNTTGITANYAFVHTSGFVAWQSILSPAQITSDQNDYNPTGWTTGGAPAGASILRINSDASRNVTSLAGGFSGRLVLITNVGSNNIVIKDDDGSTGTAANRFALTGDITMQPDRSLMFWYDITSNRWRVNL